MKKSLLYILFLSILISSCKKEIIEGPTGAQGVQGTTGVTGNNGFNGADPRLFYQWRVIASNINSAYEIKCLLFNTDNSVYELQEYSIYGLRLINYGTQLITNTQLTLFGGERYNYTISNDTLRLSNTHRNVSAIRRNDIPTPNEWVVPVASLDSITLSKSYEGDIAFDGNYLWLTDPGENEFDKVNLFTRSLDTLQYSGLRNYYASVGYAQDYLWVSATNGTLHKVDRNTGQELQASPPMGQYINQGIAFDGKYLLCTGISSHSKYRDSLYTYDPISNTVISQWNIPYFTGIEYADGHLYACYENMIYKCTLSPLRAVKTYKILSARDAYDGITGIAYDGSNFWVKLKSSITDDNELHKVHLD